MAGERWTPGPWRKDYDNDVGPSDDSYEEWWSIRDARGDEVARVSVPRYRGQYEAEASADLVTASPDLYSALEACLDGGSFKHPQIVERAQKALARARGETT